MWVIIATFSLFYTFYENLLSWKFRSIKGLQIYCETYEFHLTSPQYASKCIYVFQMHTFSRLCFPDAYTHLCTHSEKNRKEIFKREMGREEKQDEEGEPLLDSKIGSFGYKPKARRALWNWFCDGFWDYRRSRQTRLRLCNHTYTCRKRKHMKIVYSKFWVYEYSAKSMFPSFISMI